MTEKSTPKPKPKAKTKPQPALRPQQPPAILSVVELALDTLRNGILQEDWSLVRAAFTQLTGQELPPSAAPDYRAMLERLAGQVSEAFSSLGPCIRRHAMPASSLPAIPQEEIFPNQEQDELPNDEPTAGEEVEMSRRESARAAGRSRQTRDPLVYLDLTCTRCHQVRKVHPVDRPRRLDAGDQPSSFVCEFCQASR